MAAQQRRLLSASNSKLGKVDIAEILRQEGAWSQLPRETRVSLCALLPPQPGVEHDPDLNPMWGLCAPYIEKELRAWQENLKEGRETQKWKTEALQAGQDRRIGKFDEWKQRKREDFQSRQQMTTTATSAFDSHLPEIEDGAQLDDASGVKTLEDMTADNTIREAGSSLQSN